MACRGTPTEGSLRLTQALVRPIEREEQVKVGPCHVQTVAAVILWI